MPTWNACCLPIWAPSLIPGPGSRPRFSGIWWHGAACNPQKPIASSTWVSAWYWSVRPGQPARLRRSCPSRFLWGTWSPDRVSGCHRILRAPQMHDPKLPRLTVLISGHGSNLQALIDACRNGTLAARIGLVVASRPDAYGLMRAREADIPTATLPWKQYRAAGKSRSEYDQDLAAVVADSRPDLIVLAGWLRVLTHAFLSRFPPQGHQPASRPAGHVSRYACH